MLRFLALERMGKKHKSKSGSRYHQSSDAFDLDAELSDLEFQDGRRGSNGSAVNLIDQLLGDKPSGDYLGEAADNHRSSKRTHKSPTKSRRKRSPSPAPVDPELQRAYEAMTRGKSAAGYIPASSKIGRQVQMQSPPVYAESYYYEEDESGRNGISPATPDEYDARDYAAWRQPNLVDRGQDEYEVGEDGMEAMYWERRHQQSRAERETDIELAKKGRRAFRRRKSWHPIALLETASRTTLLIIAGSVVAGLILAILLTFLLWPRACRLEFLGVDHDTNAKPYFLLPAEKSVHLQVNSQVRVRVSNANFVPALIKKSQVTLYWVRKDGAREMFGGTVIDEETVLPKRSHHDISLPLTIAYSGNPREDPIYEDFVERCFTDVQAGEEEDGSYRAAEGDGLIYLSFEIEVTTQLSRSGSAKKPAKERTGRMEVVRTMGCPMGPSQIQDIFDTLFAGEHTFEQ